MNGTANNLKNGANEQIALPDGRMMGYAQYGRRGGIPVLAIHGTPGSRKMMQPADANAASLGIRLIAPDRPGYGLSSPHPGYQLSQWVEDVEHLLALLEIDSFHLFGISGGGPFATAVATLMPHRVRTLALVSPVGLFDQHVRKNWSWRHQLFFQLLPRSVWLMKLLFPFLRLFILHAPSLPLNLFIRTLGKSDQLILDKPQHAEQLLVAFRDGFRRGIEGAIDDVRIFSSPWRLSLENASMPVILWQGMDDKMVPPQAALRLAEAFTNAESIILQGEGHFWIFEHIEEVLQQLLTSDTSK